MYKNSVMKSEITKVIWDHITMDYIPSMKKFEAIHTRISLQLNQLLN
jgi:CTP:phosphocholine cytidylyltransferase-like protein